MVRLSKIFFAFILPFLIAIITVFTKSVILLALFIAIHFVILKFISDFGGRENLWMFIIFTFSSLPLNIYALIVLNDWGILFFSSLIVGLLRCILYYMILFSFEQIIMGVITRIIWQKQLDIEF